MNKLKSNLLFIISMIMTCVYFIYSYIGLSVSVLSGDGYVMFGYFIDFFLKNDNCSMELIKYPCGTTILQLPFLLVKYVYLNLNGVTVFENDEIIQHCFGGTVFFSTLFYYLLAMVFIYKLLRKNYDSKISTFSCLCITYGTMIPYYVLQNASYSHIYGLFIFALYFYLVDKYESNNKDSILNHLILGLVLGIAALIRNTHIILGSVYLFYGVTNIASFKERLKNILRPKILVQIGGFLSVLLIQLILWRVQAGHWMLYSYTGEHFDYLLNPQVIPVLFSDAKGLFIYSPVLFIGLLAMIIMRKCNKEFFIAGHVIFWLTTYIVSSWGCWWLGVCYGERMYCDVLLIFAFPLAELFKQLHITMVTNKGEKNNAFNKLMAVGVFTITIVFVLINMRWLSLVDSGFLSVKMNYWSELKNAFYRFVI